MKISRSARRDKGGDDDPEPRWWEWIVIIVGAAVLGAIGRARRCWRRVFRR
jgi:hypothetical protein